MKFVDATGHVFTQDSYDFNPVDYDYSKNKYTFWIDNKDHAYCSINNFYIRPIYILTDYPIQYLNIEMHSNVFNFISAKAFRDNFKNGKIDITAYDTQETADGIEEYSDFRGQLFYDIRPIQAGINPDNPYEVDDPQPTLLPDVEYIIPPIYDPQNPTHVGNWYDVIGDILEVPVTMATPRRDGDIIVKDTVTKFMYAFYIIGRSFNVGTFYSTMIIRAYGQDNEGLVRWDCCPITIGGEFSEENEILYINGLNMGVHLPREIIRAVYNASYSNNEFDEILYNEKIKEYLLEYMRIRGEVGNYNSAIQSLKWFGWGKHVTLSALLQTDNQFMEQFIRDYFDTESDIIESFKHFVNSTLLSIFIPENKETGEYYPYDLNAEFMGENQPVLEDLFSKFIPVKYGGLGEETYYYKRYYDFLFTEMLFKVAALKYYYDKYFLPVHLSLHNVSVHHKVYANDMKMIYRTNEHITESIVPVGICDYDYVEFPKDNEIWLTEQVHFVDEYFNEWNIDNMQESSKYNDYYYLHDTCGNIPIKYINCNENYPVHTHLILEKIIKESDNILYLNKNINLYRDKIHIYDVDKREIDLNDCFISYSTDGGKTYSIFYKGIDDLIDAYKHDNTRAVVLRYSPETEEYSIDKSSADFEWESNSDIIRILNKEQHYTYIHYKNNNIDTYRYIYIPSEYEGHIDVLSFKGQTNVITYDDVYIKVKIDNDRIYQCTIEDITYDNETKIYQKYHSHITDITDDITIKYSPSSEVVYESDYTFDPSNDEYNCLVLYPKMFNDVITDIMTNRHGGNLTDKKIDITYWIDGSFRLRMSVNNKWHEYEFVVRMSDIRLDFGTLHYKYYDGPYYPKNSNYKGNLNFISRFTQLNYLSSDMLHFNSFMYQPKLTKMNHINFIEDFVRYLNIASARYIDGSIIPANQFCYYIMIKHTDNNGEVYSQKVYISDEQYGKTLVIPRKYFEYHTIFYLFLDKSLVYILGETGINNTYEVLAVNDWSLINEGYIDDETGKYKTLYNDINNYKVFTYNKENSSYDTYTSRGLEQFRIMESLRNDFNTFTEKYIEEHTITNNYKYLNQIHVYDLYRLNTHISPNIILLPNNVDMLYHGIRFYHETFDDENLMSITGNTSNLITNSEVRQSDNMTFESELNFADSNTTYSSYVNTYDDLVIYSAYEGDWIRPFNDNDELIKPTGFIYYETVDENGIGTKEYTTRPISTLEEIIPLYLHYPDHTSTSFVSYNSNFYHDSAILSSDYKIIQNIVNNNYVSTFKYDIFDTNKYTNETIWDHSVKLSEKINVNSEISFIDYNFKYDEYYDIPRPKYMYIDRSNVDSARTPVIFKAEFIYKNLNNEWEVINPTYYDYVNNIKPMGDNYEAYKIGKYKDLTLRVYFYMKRKRLIRNVQHLYTDIDNVIYDELNHKYYININGRRIEVKPYYTSYDGNIDELFHTKALMQQPGFDWVDINDLNDVQFDITYDEEHSDYIDYTDIDILNTEFSYLNSNNEENSEENIISNNVNNYYSNDIKHLLSYRKLLVLNVTSKLKGIIERYRMTSAYDDYVTRAKENNKPEKIELLFKIDNNLEYHSDYRGVDVQSIVRAHIESHSKYWTADYEEINKNSNTYDGAENINNESTTVEEYEEYESVMIDTPENISNINIDDEQTPYEEYNNNNNNANNSSNNSSLKNIKYEYYNNAFIIKGYVEPDGSFVPDIIYDEIVVFFIVINKNNETDKEFNISINPTFNLIYTNYDKLEYPDDTYNGTTYYNDDFLEYKINDVEYKYGDCRTIPAVIDLYNEFFKQETIFYGDDFSYTEVNGIKELNIDKNLIKYDMYLMHNTKYWYIVYISKDTCDKSPALYNFNADDKIITFENTQHKYKLVHSVSTKKFLMNRYEYISKNGINHFDVDDIIVGKIMNNHRLPIDIFKTSKWEVYPMSIGLDYETHTTRSNIEMCILDAPMYNNEYRRGYYDVTYRYSLDRISTQQFKKHDSIRIG